MYKVYKDIENTYIKISNGDYISDIIEEKLHNQRHKKAKSL